jgi:6-phosphogluconolactonase (cycloisomerase 2 family)
MKPASVLWTCILVVAIAFSTGCGGSGQPAPPKPQEDFTLTVSAKAVFVPIGAGNGSQQVTVQALNGFNQSVSVSFSRLPSGVTTSPSLPVNISPGSNQTITLTAASGITPSVANISVQGTTGTLSHTASFSLSVANPSYAYLATGYPGDPPYDLVGFSVDANTGALTQVPGSPVSLSAMPIDYALASETGGAFVFLLSPGSVSQTFVLTSYSVNTATGALTSLQTINYPPQTNQSGLALDPAQKYLYVLQSGSIIAYTIDPNTGNLTQSSSSAVQFGSNLVIPEPGTFAYSVTWSPLGTGTWFIYSVNQSDGSLVLLQSYNSGTGGTLFTDPQGRALYELIGMPGPFTCGSFDIWEIDPTNGALTNLNTAFSPLCVALSLTFNPADTFAYVTSETNENPAEPNGIYGGTVDATTGNLTTVSGSPFASGTGAGFGAVEPTQGRFLLEDSAGSGGASGNNGQLLVYAIDPKTGALSAVSGVKGPLPSPYTYVGKMLTVAPNLPSPATSMGSGRR